jgi:nicotinate dehydrogenase subunit B
MTGSTEHALSRQDYLESTGSIIIMRPIDGSAEVELFLVLSGDGRLTAFNGHVDLGTGIRTALGQIVAEELDQPMERITVVLGDTERTPNQGPTIASETMQVAAVPLRQAAAQMRHFLLGLAAREFCTDVAELRMVDGAIMAGKGAPGASIRFETLVKGRKDRLMLSNAAPLKPIADYRVVGQSVQRGDIAAKATGGSAYVHDVRLPSMLHGRMVRPPYAGLDSGAFVGTSLLSVEESSIANISGIVAIVVIRDFIGIVAEREEQAAAAAEKLRVVWKPGPVMPDLQDLRKSLHAQPRQPRTLLDQGEVECRLAEADKKLARTYVWPYQLHASIGPSCAVADFSEERVKIWSGTQNPHSLRAELALLLSLPEALIEIVRLEASGCYGRNCADDVSADAVLLSRAVGRPVRVQLTRQQEHLWEPKGAAQVMQIDGGLADDGTVAAYDFSTIYPSNTSPTLALLLTGTLPPVAEASDMGDRTAIPPYRFGHVRVVVHDTAPLIRASWLRGVSAMPNSFAHECYIDELAAAAQVDPIEFRLRYLHDARAIDLIKTVAAHAGWHARTGPRQEQISDGRRRGQGAAYAQYLHGKFPGTAAAWSAWVAEVEVDIDSGDVQVTRVVVGQDNGLVINPAGVQHQIHGNVIQSVSRTLKEQMSFDRQSITSREWGSYPILKFPEVPIVQVIVMPRPQEPPLGVGESASVPSAAAISNAIFDATGVRLREPPFTAERVRSALHASEDGEHRRLRAAESWQRSGSAAAGQLDQLRNSSEPEQLPRKPSILRQFALALGGAAGLAMALLTWRSAIAPVALPDPQLYSMETITRGKQLAALGDCAECHTTAHGAENVGGRPLETPFGIIYSTNITPDLDTGIGGWSYSAFARAMREGIHRDGRHLYPAFPYTAFAMTEERDLQALYAYLMSRPPVRAVVPRTRLSFPFNIRPLMAFWNALFLRQTAYAQNPLRSAEWNRGAYLVEGLGHCSACHSPRNLLGAEAGGARHFAGGSADGWDAPALTALNHAPIPWSEPELFSYLRTGFSSFHGVAAGPMQSVVAGLAQLPDTDVRAMAHYIASFNRQLSTTAQQEMAAIREARAVLRAERQYEAGAQLFEGACAACHDSVAGTLAMARPSLALNTNLHGARPDNVIRAILDGVNVPALGHLGSMPAFRTSLDDRQIADLLGYIRVRFADGKAAWTNTADVAARLRARPAND